MHRWSKKVPNNSKYLVFSNLSPGEDAWHTQAQISIQFRDNESTRTGFTKSHPHSYPQYSTTKKYHVMIAARPVTTTVPTLTLADSDMWPFGNWLSVLPTAYATGVSRIKLLVGIATRAKWDHFSNYFTIIDAFGRTCITQMWTYVTNTIYPWSVD